MREEEDKTQGGSRGRETKWGTMMEDWGIDKIGWGWG